MSLIKLWHKKNGSHQTKKYLLPLFTALCTAALIFTGCANSANSINSSDGKKETFTITVKTQNITSKKEAAGRSIFPVLPDSEHYTLSYKSGESESWKSLTGTFPEYQMFIIPGTYTLKLDAYSDEEKQNHILTGQTKLTVTSGMKNAEVPFIMQPPETAKGNGSVNLILSAESDTKIDKFEITVDSENITLLDWTKDDTEKTYTKGTITKASVQSGTYHLTIYGKTTAGETVYVRSETLTVWSGLESSVWIFADGSFSNELKIKTDDLYSTFYVKGEEGPYNFYKEGVFGDANASDDNSGSIDCPLSTVSAAVNKCVVSNKPYTIYVDGTVKEAIDSTSTDPSAIEIYKKIITIKSIKPEVGKAVIQADGNGRIMYAGGTVVLEDLELKGGGNTNLGGGIFVGHASVLTMKNCTITECNATHQGGGLYIYSQCSANLSGCTISGNSSTGSSGGGIMANGTLIADGTSISNNNSGKDGGGIYIASGVTATLTGCELSGNSSNGDGGGFRCGEESPSATINVTFTECKIIGNTSGNNGGGGIIRSNVNATFKNCKIDGNTTKWNGGGLILFGNPTAMLEDCTISGNTANNTNGNGGGGIRTDSTGPTLILTGTTSIFDNITPSGGVGKSMYLNSGYMRISGAIQIDDDVSVRTDGDTIRTTITGTLTGTKPIITITPTGYTEGKQIVSAENDVNLSSEVEKIAVTNDSSGTAWKVDSAGKLAKK